MSIVHGTMQKTKPEDPDDDHVGWVFTKPDDPPLTAPSGEHHPPNLAYIRYLQGQTAQLCLLGVRHVFVPFSDMA